MANIAAAFLIERKSSSRRQSSIRRKKRPTNKESQRIRSERQSSCTSNMDEVFEQAKSNVDNDDRTSPHIFVVNPGKPSLEETSRSPVMVSDKTTRRRITCQCLERRDMASSIDIRHRTASRTNNWCCCYFYRLSSLRKDLRKVLTSWKIRVCQRPFPDIH